MSSGEVNEIIRQARAFETAAALCSEAAQRGGIYCFDLHTPVIVNCAFACELYLKAMICRSGGESHGHNLKELFDKLSAQQQEQVMAYMPAYYKNPLNAMGISRLELIADAFKQWRYSYEMKQYWRGKGHESCSLQIDGGYLTAFCAALRQTACRCIYGMDWLDIDTRRL